MKESPPSTQIHNRIFTFYSLYNYADGLSSGQGRSQSRSRVRERRTRDVVSFCKSYTNDVAHSRRMLFMGCCWYLVSPLLDYDDNDGREKRFFSSFITPLTFLWPRLSRRIFDTFFRARIIELYTAKQPRVKRCVR